MRLKIIAGNLVIILLVGLVSFAVVRSELQADLARQVDQRIAQEGQMLGRSLQLTALKFVDYVADRAATQQARDTYQGLDEDSRRTRAFQASNAIAQWFGSPDRGRGGAPDFVAFTDETGHVLARSQDPNRMHGVQLRQQLPELRRVFAEGVAVHDVWNKEDENKILQTGMAPIRNAEGTIIGALVVGYDLSNGLARSEADRLGREVAFITAGKVYSSSLEGDVAAALKEELFGARNAATQAALGGTTSSPWAVKLGEDDWAGVVSPLPMSPSVPVAYAVLANKTAHMAPAGTTNIVLILTALGVLLVLIYGFIIGTSFLKPVEQIEEGVLAVINGRTDLRLDVESAEFGGLAYRINQLINVFTGVEEEDEDGRVSSPPPTGGAGAAWGGSAFESGRGAPIEPQSAAAGGGAAGTPVDDVAAASQIASESEGDYMTRLFTEYVAAKSANGENVAIKQEVFAKRIGGQAEALAKKHGVKAVRFKVETLEGRVELRPVLIR